MNGRQDFCDQLEFSGEDAEGFFVSGRSARAGSTTILKPDSDRFFRFFPEIHLRGVTAILSVTWISTVSYAKPAGYLHHRSEI